jgi:zinc D-Ala-D-Ala carboxypeptidase
MPANLNNEVLQTLGIDIAAVEARALRRYEEPDPSSLELVATHASGREFFLSGGAALAWRRMQAAASADGIELVVLSAYRSVARQIEIIEKHLAEGETIEEILQSIAPPGYSEHHTGRAVDIGSADHPTIAETFADTDAFAWLSMNAATFGFTMSYPKGNASGYVYEPWHWCWNSTNNA